jgi:hypothetical protein
MFKNNGVKQLKLMILFTAVKLTKCKSWSEAYLNKMKYACSDLNISKAEHSICFAQNLHDVMNIYIHK